MTIYQLSIFITVEVWLFLSYLCCNKFVGSTDTAAAYSSRLVLGQLNTASNVVRENPRSC